jgi:hypothetical protein
MWTMSRKMVASKPPKNCKTHHHELMGTDTRSQALPSWGLSPSLLLYQSPCPQLPTTMSWGMMGPRHGSRASKRNSSLDSIQSDSTTKKTPSQSSPEAAAWVW